MAAETTGQGESEDDGLLSSPVQQQSRSEWSLRTGISEHVSGRVLSALESACTSRNQNHGGTDASYGAVLSNMDDANDGESVMYSSLLHPFRTCRAFVDSLQRHFGSYFVGMMLCNYLVLKGFLGGSGIIGLVRLSFCKKTLHINAMQCQTMGAIGWTPWTIKVLVSPNSRHLCADLDALSNMDDVRFDRD